MTVSTTTNRVSYTGDGSTVVFSFSFRMLAAGDMDVYVNGVLQSASDYDVSVNTNGVGGTVTFDTAPTSGYTVLLVRNADLTQDASLPRESSLNERTLENAYDKAIILIQQLSEQLGRAFTLPITSTLYGDLDDDGDDGEILRKKLDGTGYEFVSATVAFNDADPALGNGNVVGPSPAVSVNHGLVTWNGTSGINQYSEVTIGTSGDVLQSQGAGAAPIFVTKNFLMRAPNITVTTRTLPTSGPLSGTYVHFGNWTSAGALTFSNDTRIYVKGTFTLGHTLTGTVQANNGTNPSFYAGGWGRASGAGAGDGGYGLQGTLGLGGGGGGGCGGAGGRGGHNTAGSINAGGKAHGNVLAGGGGGGGGCGDLTANAGTNGGGGGPFIYIEVDGAITLNETIASNGANGAAGAASSGAGGGGAGGIIYIRGTSTFAIATGKKVTCNGGNGGAFGTNGQPGGGGGGGIIEIWTGGAHTLPDGAGTHVTASAGAAGTGSTPTVTQAAGSAGTTSLIASAAPVSLF